MFRQIPLYCARVAFAIYVLAGVLLPTDYLVLLVGQWWAFGWQFVAFTSLILAIRHRWIHRPAPVAEKGSIFSDRNFFEPYEDVQ